MVEGANETIGPDTFRVFTQGAATLKVLQGVNFLLTSIDLANFGFAGPPSSARMRMTEAVSQ